MLWRFQAICCILTKRCRVGYAHAAGLHRCKDDRISSRIVSDSLPAGILSVWRGPRPATIAQILASRKLLQKGCALALLFIASLIQLRKQVIVLPASRLSSATNSSKERLAVVHQRP